MEIFIGQIEKWTNKGNDKQEEADSPLHSTTGYWVYHRRLKLGPKTIKNRSIKCFTCNNEMAIRSSGLLGLLFVKT